MMMMHAESELLILATWLLTMQPAHCMLQYNCSNDSNPLFVTPSSNKFRLELSVGNGVSWCHALFHGDGRYFYVRMSSSLSSPFSLLTLRSDFGAFGNPVAWVTHSNQTVYRAFATPSNSVYARLESSSSGSSDSLALDIELVSMCPSNWTLSGSFCYGPASSDNAPVSFQDAVVGCRYVRANLATDFSVSGVELTRAMSVSGWSSSDSAWIGVADTMDGLYFVSCKVFFERSSSKIKFQGSNIYACPTSSSGDCRCIYYVGSGVFHRQYCSQRMRYLCSCRSGGDKIFYSLDTLDAYLSSEYQASFNYYWVIGLGLGLLGVVLGLGLRFICYRRAVASRRFAAGRIAGDARGGSAAATATSSYPVQPPLSMLDPPPYPSVYSNFAHYHPSGDGCVSIETGAPQRPLPPAYCEALDKPPAYDQVTTTPGEGGSGGRGN